MVNSTLKELNRVYEDGGVSFDQKPKLLSKLAQLEFYGWIEGEWDALILKLASLHSESMRAWAVDEIKSTFGFDYSKHFRPMLVKLFGEVGVLAIENDFEVEHRGDLERLKSLSGTYWKRRCDLAHSDLSGSTSQSQFDAPSWVLNQHKIISQLMDNFSTSAESAVSGRLS
jgi:hypothetical protein